MNRPPEVEAAFKWAEKPYLSPEAKVLASYAARLEQELETARAIRGHDECIAEIARKDEALGHWIAWWNCTGIGKSYSIIPPIDKTRAALSPAPVDEKPCDCECGHHENDHSPSPVTGRGQCCGGGLSDSCACRKFRPAENPKEPLPGSLDADISWVREDRDRWQKLCEEHAAKMREAIRIGRSAGYDGHWETVPGQMLMALDPILPPRPSHPGEGGK